MSDTPNPQDFVAQIMGKLMGPGGPFELAPAEVLGATIPVFVNANNSLGEVLADSAQYGDRVYIGTADRRITFTEHLAMVSSLAEQLREQYGIKPGDRVAINAANSPEWIIAFWAAASLGAITVCLNAWWSAKEVAYGLSHSEPALLMVDERTEATVGETDVPVLRLETDVVKLATTNPQAELQLAEVAPDDPAAIVYTSGTSGQPKGAVHTHRAILSVLEYHRMSDALNTAFGSPLDPRDRSYLLASPLFHIASLHNLAIPRLGTGSKVALYEGAFDADRVLALIEKEKVTNWGAVPTMARRLLDHPNVAKYDTSSLEAFSLASAPSTPAFHERLKQQLPFVTGDTLVNSYGLTETCTAVAVATPPDLAAAPDSLGKPIVAVEVQIRDSEGNQVPAGVEGEICVRSVYNMLGYWRDEEASSQTISADRWLHTGDIGWLDTDGRLHLNSRRTDLIIRGGENVYPAEIEGTLLEHPAVTEAVVLGVPHDDLGQEVGAVVVLREGASATEEELAEYVGQQLAYFKVPQHWRFSDTPLPRNATGKVKRTEVEL